MKQTQQAPQAQPNSSGLSLDFTTMATAFREVVATYLHIHTAETEREKSQALRAHTAALLQYIDILDTVVPDGMQVPITSTIAGHSYNNTHTITTNTTL